MHPTGIPPSTSLPGTPFPMSSPTAPIGPASKAQVVYPERDGKPTSDNTKQFRWMTMLAGNLAALFYHRLDVFIGGDLLWYPVEGEPEIRMAPDVFVVFGRPRGDRGSYRQWEEGGVPMTVVFEILSPGNTAAEMVEKMAFYDDYGVGECYIYNPDRNFLYVDVRKTATLVRERKVDGFVSPRLGIRFDLSGPEMIVRYPDGQPFLTFEQLREQQQLAQQRADKAEQRAEKAEQEAARLAELSRKLMEQQLTPEDRQELERLLQVRSS